MAHTWLTIQVDLVEGHGEHLWPRPGSDPRPMTRIADARSQAECVRTSSGR
jgi:hypothetical protein